MPRKQQSEADALWAQADEYAAVANDPGVSPEVREMAQREYAEAVTAAQLAEAAES